MNDNTILEAFQKFLKDLVLPGVELQKPPAEGDLEIEYVAPYVCIGYLPPKNFLPEGYDVPGIIVGMEQGQDDNDEASLLIKLTFITYGAGTYSEDMQLIPDMLGYKDLLSLMAKTRTKLSSNPVIEGVTVVQKPIKWGMYQDQPWPYWYGWMTFGVSAIVQDMINTLSKDYL